MANGTPSTSISLGAELLEQMGDLKGAAKELSAEAKNAKKDVSDAQKEFKELEKQQKKNEREAAKIRSGMDKMTGKEKADAERQIAELMDSSKVDSALKKVLDKKSRVDAKLNRSQVLKDKAKDRADNRRDMLTGFNAFDRRISSRLTQAQDSMHTVANMLAKNGGAVGNAAAKVLGRASGALSSGTAQTIAGGMALSALPAAAVAGGFAVAQMYQNNRKDEAEIRSRSNSEVLSAVSGLRGTTSSADAINAMFEKTQSAEGRATQLMMQRWSVLASEKGISGNLLGINKKRETLAATLRTEALNQPDLVSKFGAEFAKKVSIKEILDNPSFKSKVQNDIAGRGATGRSLRGATEAYYGAVGSFFGLSDEQAGLVAQAGGAAFGQLTGVQSLEEEMLARAQAQASSQVTSAEKRRTEARRLANVNPAQVAERHVRATQSQGLERQRQRREMQTASF